MFSDFKEECRTRLLQYFPERQIYLRTQSEVKYYHLSTRLQAGIASALGLMAIWCVFTIGNVIWGYNPFSSSSKQLRVQEANFERAMAEERAKLQNTQLMLSQQKESFEKIARSFEQKHAAISQILVAPQTSNDKTADVSPIKYAESRILMNPRIRDPFPRDSLREFEPSPQSGDTQVDRFMVNLGESQDTVLKAAELEMLDDIERKRAIIRSTNIELTEILESSPYGKGGPSTQTEDSARLTTAQFIPRMDTVTARTSESDILTAALASMPLGHPIDDENYATSRYGMRPDPFTKRPTFHAGLDYGSSKNARIVAASGGVVTRAGRNGGMGRMVEIDHGFGFKTRYGHLNKLNVKRGQRVSKGQLIGGMGSTGRSTSTHLHYEVYFQGRTVDPSHLIKAGQYVQ
jgi:murein DD-endopeptidase MepM/ murein hydrolase activator NlpD